MAVVMKIVADNFLPLENCVLGQKFNKLARKTNLAFQPWVEIMEFQMLDSEWENFFVMILAIDVVLCISWMFSQHFLDGHFSRTESIQFWKTDLNEK